jgi:hypothetical protein
LANRVVKKLTTTARQPHTTYWEDFAMRSAKSRTRFTKATSRPSFRPAIQAFEDRWMPSTYTWQGATDGNWFDSSRWKDQVNQPGIPGCGDVANIGGGFTVTINGNACASALYAGSRVLIQSGGLSIQSGPNNYIGELDMLADTVLNTPDNHHLGLNFGVSDLAGTINVGDLATFGTVNFILTNAINTPAGSFTYLGGANLSKMALNTGAQLNGSGTYWVPTCGVNCGGVYLTVNSDVDVENLTIHTNHGIAGPNKLTVKGTMTWVAGSMIGTGSTVIAEGATLNLTGPLSMDDRTLDNRGTTNWVAATPGALSSQVGATFNNFGTANVRNELDWHNGSGVFNNFGTLTKTSLSGLGMSYSNANLNNFGTIRAVSGEINVGGGTSTGTFHAEAGGTIRLSEWQTYTLNAGAQFTGPGFTHFTGGNGTLLVNAAVPVSNLALYNGHFDLTSAANLNFSGRFEFYAGDISGPGAMTFSKGSFFEWYGGLLDLTGTTTILPRANLLLKGSGAKYLWYGVLNNQGGMRAEGSGFSLGNGAVLNNTGFMYLDADGCICNSANSTINNSNRITKTSSGTLHLGGEGVFNNTGTVSVTAGTLETRNGMNSNVFTVATVAKIRFPQYANYTMGTGAKMLGNGTYDISLGTLNIDSDVSANRVELNSGALAGTGNFTINQSILWSGGTMYGPGTTTISPSATMTITGQNKGLSARTLTNNGTVNWTATDVGSINLQGYQSFGYPTINNYGAFNVQSDQDIIGAGGIVNNYGTWTKTSPILSGTTQITRTFNNTGVVVADNGVLELFGGGTSTGQFDVEADGAIHFTQLTHNVGTGTSFTGPGFTRILSGTFNVQGGVTAENLAQDGGVVSGAGNLTITDTYEWNAGSISNTVGTGSVTIAAGGALNIKGNVDKSLAGKTLNIVGAATWRDSGNINLSSGATINVLPAGTFTIQNDRNINGSGFFSNKGTLTKVAGVGTTTIVTAVPFTNDGGTVNGQSGFLKIDKFTQNAGSTHIAPGAVLASSNLTILGGTLTLDVASTSSFGKLTVTGTATLGGTLNVNFLSSPVIGDTYTVVTATTVSGTFAAINPTNLGAGKQLAVAYNPTNVTLTVTSTAGPGTGDDPFAADFV